MSYKEILALKASKMSDADLQRAYQQYQRDQELKIREANEREERANRRADALQELIETRADAAVRRMVQSGRFLSADSSTIEYWRQEFLKSPSLIKKLGA